ncbi:MAG: hypothetical protein RLN86_09440 [Cyclobacteriaceae bacterium]
MMKRMQYYLRGDVSVLGFARGMRICVILLFFLIQDFAHAQGLENPLVKKVTASFSVPENLLAKRSFAIYNSSFSKEELIQMQGVFQKTGIDASGYFLTDMVFANQDAKEKVAAYLAKREVSFLIFIEKENNNYTLYFTPFNGDNNFVNEGQNAWKVSHENLSEALQIIYRTAVNNQPIKNLLINNYPETNFGIELIDGRRSDFFAIDLKVDNLAIPWFEDPEMDSTIKEFFSSSYPNKYSHTSREMSMDELQRNGFHYVLSYVHTQGAIAKELLEYEISDNESAITSITYPNGSEKLKTIASDKLVYKFYFKHIRSGNVFLGTKWDADVNWLDALRNHIKGFKAELKIP